MSNFKLGRSYILDVPLQKDYTIIINITPLFHRHHETITVKPLT